MKHNVSKYINKVKPQKSSSSNEKSLFYNKQDPKWGLLIYRTDRVVIVVIFLKSVGDKWRSRRSMVSKWRLIIIVTSIEVLEVCQILATILKLTAQRNPYEKLVINEQLNRHCFVWIPSYLYLFNGKSWNILCFCP